MSGRKVLLIGAISGLMGSAASAGLVADFESPTFTAPTHYGVGPMADGWSVLASYADITPGVSPQRFAAYPAPPNFDQVLSGSQSLAVEGNSGWVTKRISSDPDLGDGATLSWLMRVDGTTGAVSAGLSKTLGGINAGFAVPVGGNFAVTGGSTIPDATLALTTTHVYLMEMTLDFTNGAFEGYVTDNTIAGPRTHIGHASFTTGITVSDILTTGGIFIDTNVQGPANFAGPPGGNPLDPNYYSGAPFFDDFKITAVPEPASAGLLSLGALALLRRRRGA